MDFEKHNPGPGNLKSERTHNFLEDRTMTTTREGAVADPLNFLITDVTARCTLEVEDIDGHRPVRDVAQSMASLMELPSTTPYALRDDGNARMLEDEVALGSQITTGAELVVIPRAHLA